MRELRKKLLALGFGLLAFAGMAGTAAIDIPATAKGPAIDGALDDPAWKRATKIEKLYSRDTGQAASDTTVFLTRDNQWLYVGFRCDNPDMPKVTQKGFRRDSAVYSDDSAWILIRPDTEKSLYYLFVLNFGNALYDELCSKEGFRQRGWNPPVRSMTKRTPDGWTGEIAIPLFALENDGAREASVNLGRGFAKIELDAMGAIQGETLAFRALRPDNKGGFHDFNNFLPINGLLGVKPEVPFAPLIVAAETTGYRRENGEIFYGIEATLKPGSSTRGEVDLIVLEDTGRGDVVRRSERVRVDGERRVTIRVETADFQPRRVKMLLVSPGDKTDVLAFREIDNASELAAIRKAFVGRSYYTTEPAASVRLEFGLPKEILDQARLTIAVNGKTAREIDAPLPVMTPEIPLSELEFGPNPITVRLLLDGKELAAKELVAQRLKPCPGHEVKLDYLRGAMLKNGQPFFPIGIYGHLLQSQFCRDGKDDEARAFRYLGEEIGFNAIIRLWAPTSALDSFMTLAGKYGMNVIGWSYPRVETPLETLKPDDKLAALLPENLKREIKEKGSPAEVARSMSLTEKLRVRRAAYEKAEAEVVAEIRKFESYENALAYYNVDEPNLLNFNERIAVAEWYYKTVKAEDPYHPLFLLYSMNVPYGDNWTRWGEILGYDIYPRPHTGGLLSEPGLYTAVYAYALRERCRQDNKVMWFVPSGNRLDLGRTPIGLTGAEMRCQAYTAIIYGARGLLYFALNSMIGEEAWDAARSISFQVKELAPALLNGDVSQEIRYAPGEFSPAEQKFPMVNAAVFKYPDDDYLLLAANIKAHAVNTSFRVDGLQKATRLFSTREARSFGERLETFFGLADSEEKMAINDGAFTDKLEPYGTRAYKLKIDHPEETIRVALNMTAIQGERAPSVDVAGIFRRLARGKNYCPNPCFARQTNKGVPDFTRLKSGPQHGGECYVDSETLWEGRPSLRIANVPREKSILPVGPLQGIFGYVPASDKPVRMTFSFYAKSEKPGAKLFVAPTGARVSFALTPEWRRYHMTFDMPGTLGPCGYEMDPSRGAGVWINGLQLERGDKPTEFRDDSELEKTEN